ncbi:MAG: DUF2911 domain-containing protein [Chitinophagales bacterium]|nr:DUF2911 domain-containing protein [Chitinophagales bacterium]
MHSKLFYVILTAGTLLFSCKQNGDEKTLSKDEKQEVMQNKNNRVSPTETASDTIGGNEVTIVYGSPRVKGRVIWGGLVPYNEVWRMGANEASTIQFTKDVFVQGQPLKKDTYSVFALPSENEWTIIFSTNEKQWGAFKYNESEDALRIKVKPVFVDSLQENMTLSIEPDPANPNKGSVKLWWEKLQVKFDFENAQ